MRGHDVLRSRVSSCIVELCRVLSCGVALRRVADVVVRPSAEEALLLRRCLPALAALSSFPTQQVETLTLRALLPFTSLTATRVCPVATVA
jgi:hypothetical protein